MGLIQISGSREAQLFPLQTSQVRLKVPPQPRSEKKLQAGGESSQNHVGKRRRNKDEPIGGWRRTKGEFLREDQTFPPSRQRGRVEEAKVRLGLYSEEMTNLVSSETDSFTHSSL